MKKLLIMSIISASLLANKVEPYIVGGLSTNHLFEEDKEVLNENNHLYGIGFEYKKYELTYLNFDNSFRQNTDAILIRKNVDMKWNISYNYGVAFTKGYTKNYVFTKDGVNYKAPNGFVLYKDYGVMPTIGLTYNTKHIDLNCDLFGNALITSVKYKF